MVADYVPDAGDLIKVDFRAGQIGHEQAGWCPALVLSPRGYNKKTGLAVVGPVTSAIKGYPFEVNLPAGLKTSGTILSDAARSIDWRERQVRYFESPG
jgi:mRNA interferase MazF